MSNKKKRKESRKVVQIIVEPPCESEDMVELRLKVPLARIHALEMLPDGRDVVVLALRDDMTYRPNNPLLQTIRLEAHPIEWQRLFDRIAHKRKEEG